ncbi:LAMI_0E03884g1_1 [Lachancea mirantina]|uniref:LAMI_0E03884g1_1 n=1 Tax=Lachancea mirantina TaxID=1230905 RepID=A0A1G4JKH2_9SACH|nr:LAMI_0E03884g1_1 [Lachancea mirantina]
MKNWLIAQESYLLQIAVKEQSMKPSSELFEDISSSEDYVVVETLSEEISHEEPELVSLNDGISENEVDDSGSESESDSSDSSDLPYYEQAIEDIKKGDRYPCMICTMDMDFSCSMYACKSCFRVFDYECISEWAAKSVAKNLDKSWKCPNCLAFSKKVPLAGRNTCWCGKTVNPEPNILEPNSCGQTCDARICIHGCNKACHLGPHPTCMASVRKRCLCGKESKNMFCNESRKIKGSYQCSKVCDLTLPCGFHKCTRRCHRGPCGECPQIISGELKCFCGLESKTSMPCADVHVTKKSRNARGSIWIGTFACSNVRTVEFACKNHSFTERCEAPPSISGKVPCRLSPKLLTTCPCGKTPLLAMDIARTSCTDPVPTCENQCGRPLKCGKHLCPFICHTGPCMDPCLSIDKVKCACETKQFTKPCRFEDTPRCQTKCESLMSCRRHRCTERCCSGKSAARNREKKIFLAKDKLDESLVEAKHICLKPCNRLLACGQHSCRQKCHPGSCPPCLESDSNDLVCPCGSTLVPAPVRCGTTLPPCRHPCVRTRMLKMECGHKPMPHACHPLDMPCPGCTAPVFRRCKCGKSDKVRTLCFQDDVSCGMPCGKTLQNCHHKCQKTCHVSQACQTVCQQVCRKSRYSCNHTCAARCHGLSKCPDIPCKQMVTQTCTCQRLRRVLPCGATESSSSAGEAEIPCTEDCEVARRHLELMEAFGVRKTETGLSSVGAISNLVGKVNTYEELLIPFSELTLSVYGKHPEWCTQIERALSGLMSNKAKLSLHFKPMPAPKRSFIHELAKAYGLYSESQDKDPKRSVYVKKTHISCEPSISLEEAFPLYEKFNNYQREKRKKEMKSSTTHKLVNYPTANFRTATPKLAEFNGILIKNVFTGVTELDISEALAIYFKTTLISNPQFRLLETGDAIAYPELYGEVSVNVENDIKRLVGHFDVLVRDKFLAEGSTLCKVETALVAISSSIDVSQELSDSFNDAKSSVTDVSGLLTADPSAPKE